MKLAHFIFLLFLLLLLPSCAPVAEPEPAAPSVEVPTPLPPTPEPEPTATPQPAPTSTPEPVVDAEPQFDPENPDWELLYKQLYAKYIQEFTAPEIGTPMTLELESGRRVQGVLSGLSDVEVQLTVGAGMIAYHHSALSPVSRALLFAPAYADANARSEGSREFQAWQRRQQLAQVPEASPTLPPYVEIEEEEEQEEPEVIWVGIPKNEGPDGRVRQVEEYIIRNAAIPSSLKIKAWGPVQKHKNGFKVRVQYSLESAGGLGTSHEDMMFFMSGRGRVYQRAPVK